jgi:predicted RNase H-like HicB family nuclease
VTVSHEQAADTLELAIRLSCFSRQEQDYWVSGCPALNVYSQADDEEGARVALQEAVELWIDSCLERNTLHQALTELGWHRIQSGALLPVDGEYIGVAPVESAGEILGHPFPIEVTIPAYQAALLMGNHGRAAC